MHDLTGALALEVRQLRESADLIEAALGNDLTALSAARTLVKLSSVNAVLVELEDELQGYEENTNGIVLGASGG